MISVFTEVMFSFVSLLMYHSLVCVEPSLHLRDKFPLGAGESPFSFSGSIRYILVRIFVSVNQGQHHSLLYLSGFGIMLMLHSRFGSIPYFQKC